ncbi:MAG TPA: sterol desaturase family protein [Acidimicrobiales bacterium]|nr:sterol desaturase family protein [Acidimicrobiales bacterium]
MTAAVALFLVAFPFWTLAEYVLHRFLMHAARGRGLASREHLRHHAERDSILESWQLAWTGVVLVGAGLGAAAVAAGAGPAGWALGAGWVAAYGVYDWIHWRAHRRPVANRYERFVRRHHFHHHFGRPLANHGVTTPIWDLVFGTYERVEGPVRVPRRLAMVWLVDERGDVRPEYAGDYVLVGRRPSDERQRELDRARAFANLAPEV